MRRWEQSGNVSKMLVFGPNIQGKDCAKIALERRKCLQKLEYIFYMANVGIEPKTFALLARRSNQLS